MPAHTVTPRHPKLDRMPRKVALPKRLCSGAQLHALRSSILSGQYFWQTGLGAILQGARDHSDLSPHSRGKWLPHRVHLQGRSHERPLRSRQAGCTTASPTSRPNGLLNSESTEMLHRRDAAELPALEARPEEKPFCYWWGPTNTHRTARLRQGAVEPDDLEGSLPAFLPDVHDIREDALPGRVSGGRCWSGCPDRSPRGHRRAGQYTHRRQGSFPRSATSTGCEVALAARWPERIPSARVVDFVNLMDLAPAFLDARALTSQA